MRKTPKAPKKRDSLLTLEDAATLFGTTVAAIQRMQREGLVRDATLGDEALVMGPEMMRVEEAAKRDPRILTCECLEGPCCCL